MKKIILVVILHTCCANFLFTQTKDVKDKSILMLNNKGLNIGGYAQIDYNHTGNSENIFNNSTLDVHRFVTFFGYNFNEKTSFFAEIEMEHVVELYVEQAFLSHKLNNNITLNTGLMLIPMGIQNLNHEPPTFNGVERTKVDKYIVPTTWREIGIGISGRFTTLSINYELMAVNGFNGYSNGNGLFNGSSALRSGRQKGAESYLTQLDFAARLSFYGEPGLLLGVSAYIGDSESEEYNNLDLNNDFDVISADSTIVGINMLGFDARYNNGPFHLRGQYVFANISNTEQYNTISNSDLGKRILGFYAELGYNLLKIKENDQELIGFFRYENYDTHNKVDEKTLKNTSYNRTEITVGLGWKLVNGAMLKADYQILSNASESDTVSNKLNFGIAIWF